MDHSPVPRFLVSKVTQSFARADVELNGTRPWDIQIRDSRFYARVARDGTLGLGESYMEGWWDVGSLDQLFDRLARTPGKKRSRSLKRYSHWMKSRFTNLQSKSRAVQVADAHYNLSNELYELMLDPEMQYSAGYWKDVDNLKNAQLAKLERICQKLELKPGDHVLEIGGGWGGLANYMATRRGCKVTSLNISKAQIAYSRKRNAGLDVQVLEKDYREANGQYDKVVSIEMFEAVGLKNFRIFMETVERCLKPGGLFLLQTIAENFSRPYADRWITKYIFPNGQLPSPARLTLSFERLFNIEDWESFGDYYDLTMLAWDRNFEAAWPRIQALDPRFDERFRRMWRYYLLSSAGSYRARNIQVWQVLLSKTSDGRKYRHDARA